MGSWAMGIFMAVLAVMGLFAAAGARDGTMEWVGLLLMGFGVAYCYGLIIKNTGH